QLSASITQQYCQLSRNSSKKRSTKLRSVQRAMASLQRSYPHFYFKQKVTEEFVHLADEAYHTSLYLQTELAKRPREKKKRLQLGNRVRESEKNLWLSLGEYAKQYQARTIRIPVHMIETINKLMRVQKQLVQEYGREPTPDEVAEEVLLPVDRVRAVLKMAQQPISLQSPVGESEETNFGDFIEDKGAENPSDMTAIVLLKEKIKDVLETLTERERQVLEQRFGLVDGYSRTLEEVGRQFQVTRERIRQIEAKALRKMRHPTRIRQLEGFLEAPEL